MPMENLADELDRRFTALWHVLARRGKRELSRTAASVLATLRDTGPRRITELAESEAVAQPTVTSLVGRLERDGFVERRSDPADARAVLVHLTDAGRARLDEMRVAREAVLEQRLAALTEHEREVLANALPVLDKLMREEPEA
jgi:DNA-binding MarR family transcriptional regulator